MQPKATLVSVIRITGRGKHCNIHYYTPTKKILIVRFCSQFSSISYFFLKFLISNKSILLNILFIHLIFGHSLSAILPRWSPLVILLLFHSPAFSMLSCSFYNHQFNSIYIFLWSPFSLTSQDLYNIFNECLSLTSKQYYWSQYWSIDLGFATLNISLLINMFQSRFAPLPYLLHPEQLLSIELLTSRKPDARKVIAWEYDANFAKL